LKQSKRTLVLARLFYFFATKSIKRDFDYICSVSAELNGNIYSPLFIDALLVAEDKRFYRHPGFDILAIIRALYSFIVRRHLQGASTIEQQFVRTITGRYELSLRRKIREIYLSVLLSLSVQKEFIARHYLSVAYFGWQMNGLQQACQRLQLNPENISIEGAANVIARIRYPEPELATEYRKYQILRRTKYILSKINSKQMAPNQALKLTE